VKTSPCYSAKSTYLIRPYLTVSYRTLPYRSLDCLTILEIHYLTLPQPSLACLTLLNTVLLFPIYRPTQFTLCYTLLHPTSYSTFNLYATHDYYIYPT